VANLATSRNNSLRRFLRESRNCEEERQGNRAQALYFTEYGAHAAGRPVSPKKG
jgi:hypothetical protein